LAVQGLAWLVTGVELDRSGPSWQPSLLAWMPEMVMYSACSGLVHVVARSCCPAAALSPRDG